MNWIQHPVSLVGEKVLLEPLERGHIAELQRISADPRIWEYMSMSGADTVKFRQYLESAVLKRATGEQYAFTVRDRMTDDIIGTSMFYNMFPEYRKLEIGYTWYDPAYWRTGHNRECKLLMLTYCFEVLKTIRVQFLAGETNMRSRKAIEGIGAKLEGILRNERIRPDGLGRNTAVFSIIDSEWPHVKELLTTGMTR